MSTTSPASGRSKSGNNHMPGINDLREARAKKMAEAKKMNDEIAPNAWSADHKKKFDALMTEVDNLDAEMDRVERIMSMTAERLRDGSGLTRQAAYGADKLTVLNAVGDFMRTGDRGAFRNAVTEGGTGGIIVPAEISTTITAAMGDYRTLRPWLNVVRLQTAHSKYVQPHSPTGAGTEWSTETSTRNETTAPSLVAITFTDAELNALVMVSAWWEEDSLGGAQFLIREFARAYVRAENAAFVNGDGVNKPRGMLAVDMTAEGDDVRDFGKLQVVLSLNHDAITADELVNLQYSLRAEYRQRAVWLMNSATLAAVRRLKDAQGQYLWAPTIAPNEPPTLLGHEVVECNDMPDIAADATPVIFGDLRSGYTVVDRVDSLLRDPFSHKPYVAYYARRRVSGNVTDTCALKVLKMANS